MEYLQSITKDTFKWLEETLEAEGIGSDNDPDSPASILMPMTPENPPTPLLPAPIIIEGRDLSRHHEGGMGLGLEFSSSFEVGADEVPVETSYFTSPDTTPKATTYSRPNYNVASDEKPPKFIVATKTFTTTGPVAAPRPQRVDYVQPPGIYLDSIVSAWNGDHLTRYPLFPGACADTDSTETNHRLLQPTSPIMAIGADTSSSLGRVERFGSEPTTSSQDLPVATPLRLRANTVATSQPCNNKGFLQPQPRSLAGNSFSQPQPVVHPGQLPPVPRPRALSISEPSKLIDTTFSSPVKPYGGVGDSNWYPPTPWDMPSWQPAEELSLKSIQPYDDSSFQQTKRPETEFLNTIQAIIAKGESKQVVTPSLGDSNVEFTKDSVDSGDMGGITTTSSFTRRSVSPELQKKKINFSRPTRSSVLLQVQSVTSADVAHTLEVVPIHAHSLPQSSPPFPTQEAIRTNNEFAIEVLSESRVISPIPLSPPGNLPTVKFLPKSRSEVSTVLTDSHIAPVSLTKTRATGLLSSLKVSASSLARLKRKLPSAVSKSSRKTPLVISYPIRKSSEHVRPMTDKRTPNSKPAFSKSSAMKPPPQRPPPAPPLFSITPENGELSAQTMIHPDRVYGGMAGTAGSSRVVHTVPKRI